MKTNFKILFVFCSIILFGCVKDLDRDNPLDNYASENDNLSENNSSEEKSGLFVDGFQIISDNNGDLKVNKGESIKLSVKIKNGTSETINEVKATISCSNQYVSNIINSGPKSFYNNGYSSSSYNYINSGAWGTTSYDDYLEFDVSEVAPDDTVLVFDVKITDESGNIWNDTLKVTVVSINASLSVQGFTIESDNNDDSKVNKGESIKLSIKLQNTGSSKANGVKGEVSCVSSYVSNMINVGPKPFYNNGYSSSSYDYINSGSWGAVSYSNYLEFDVSEDTPVGTELIFSIKISDEFGNIWNDTFKVTVVSTEALFSVQGFTVESDNNDDSKVNKGESIKLSLRIQNTGSSKANGVKGEISCSNSYVSNLINTGPKSFYNNGYSSYDYINSGSWGAASYSNYLEFDVSEDTPNGTELVFSIKITDESGNVWNDNFTVIVVSTDASISFQSFTIESDNNNDSRVNRGESIILAVKLQNTGTSKANKVKGEISCSNPYISNMINKGPKIFYNNGYSSSSYDFINSSSWGKASYSNFLEFDVSPSAPFGSVTFNITITDESNNIWYDSFNIIVE